MNGNSNGNVPAALSTSMGMEKKPFTYLPGGIDFSELKSPKMQKRINKHLQGGPGGQPTDQTVMIYIKLDTWVCAWVGLAHAQFHILISFS